MDPSDECFAFASFRLYPRRRTLLHENDLIAIGGRAFDVLFHLVSHAGNVINSNELMQVVWPSVTVEEANLRVQMGLLRKILSRCKEAQRAIETVPLRGYCFTLPVQHRLNSTSSTEFSASVRTNLPILLNTVIGREEAIEMVATALGERRLVTITGPGGIGKTTVAVATARRYAAIFPGFVCITDLAKASNIHEVARFICEALKLTAEDDALASLCDYLSNEHVLLVLDTCEHIVDELAVLAEVLLGRCFHLKLLVTSREALRAAGECTYRLSSLSFPGEDDELTEETMSRYDAITLFMDRLRASSHVKLQNKTLALIGEICRRLDGIPLALEFAAARMPDLGLQEIAANLDDCFAILTRGKRTAVPRHRTLAATLDWSFRLLSAAEQTSLRHLATLPRYFTSQDAGELLRRIGYDVLPEVLSSLYEKSLLSVDCHGDTPVYRLFDTTKSYVMNPGIGSVHQVSLLAPQNANRVQRRRPSRPFLDEPAETEPLNQSGKLVRLSTA